MANAASRGAVVRTRALTGITAAGEVERMAPRGFDSYRLTLISRKATITFHSPGGFWGCASALLRE